jgi:hypothetical protein
MSNQLFIKLANGDEQKTILLAYLENASCSSRTYCLKNQAKKVKCRMYMNVCTKKPKNDFFKN